MENNGEVCTLQPIVEFWEDKTLPSMSKTSKGFSLDLLTAYHKSEIVDSLMDNPYLDYSVILKQQLNRIIEIVNFSYESIPFYRNKFQAVGFRPGDLKTIEDYHKLPITTKDELIEVFPNYCISNSYEQSSLFPTRSSGSSGKTLRIMVDEKAVITDTLQGVRQFNLQTGNNYNKHDLLTHIYTVPWRIDNLDGDYQSVFISSLIPPQKIGEILDGLDSNILSLYPSNLNSIIPYISEKTKKKLKLITVHSEMSSREERKTYSNILGVPVLDEYSSEELTRIALELPCGHYHICEDTVRLDIVNPSTYELMETGTGLVVATNLLNTAMPFIRYLQGDQVTIETNHSCNINWRQIKSVEGRHNDAFVTSKGRIIPAGTLLDITYRAMFDSGVNLKDFELIQKSFSNVDLNVVDNNLLRTPELISKIESTLKGLLNITFGEEINIEFNLKDQLAKSGKKRRPIRKEF